MSVTLISAPLTPEGLFDSDESIGLHDIAFAEELSALSMGAGNHAEILQFYAECLLKQLKSSDPEQLNEVHIVRGEN